MREAEKLKSEIEQTRAELAETVDALAARLDVKAQASRRAHEMHAVATQAYDNAKASAPPQVRQAWDRAEVAAQPVVTKAREDPKRTAMVAGGVVLALLVLIRLRRSRR